MSFLLEKSKENSSAFLLLKERRYLSLAIHCGYYSCLQKIIYILQDFYTADYEAEMQQYAGRQKGNLHKMCINLFCANLRTFSGEARHDARELKNKIKELKDFRIASDYNETKIMEKDIAKVEEYTLRIHRLIKKHMDI